MPTEPSETSEPTGVLSYASPISRRSKRAPIRTRIIIDSVNVSFVEESAEKLYVVAAIVLSCVSLGMLAWQIHDAVAGGLSMHGGADAYRIDRWITCGVLGGLGITVIVLIFMVIQQTWRRTTLAVREGELVLEIRAPFGSRDSRWPASEVSLEVAADSEPATAGSLGQLRLHARGAATLVVFKNYGLFELDPILLRLERALGSKITSIR